MVASPLWPMTSWMASINRRTRSLGSTRPPSATRGSGQADLVNRVAGTREHEPQPAIDGQRGGIGVLGVDGQLAYAAAVVIVNQMSHQRFSNAMPLPAR